MEMENNPLIQPEDYWKQYNENIQKLKNHPEIIELDRLCYEVFEHNEQGKRFLEVINERFFMFSQVTRGNPTYQIDCIWQEGFRDAWRMIFNAVRSHKHRIKAEANKNVGNSNG